MSTKPRSDERWLVELDSDDEATVISALHAACPCSGSSDRYERYLFILRRFEKDVRPAVRKTALHLQLDAFEELAKEDERADGFVRNRAGGNEHRHKTRHEQR
ncbi:MAG: hypothetical protein QOF21_2167 [Actinomycetota bacterium]